MDIVLYNRITICLKFLGWEGGVLWHSHIAYKVVADIIQCDIEICALLQKFLYIRMETANTVLYRFRVHISKFIHSTFIYRLDYQPAVMKMPTDENKLFK